MGPVQQAVEDIVGNAGDPTIIEYLVSCLELEDETAKDASEMYSNYGSMLVKPHPSPSLPSPYADNSATMHAAIRHSCFRTAVSGRGRMRAECASRPRRLPAAVGPPARSCLEWRGHLSRAWQRRI